LNQIIGKHEGEFATGAREGGGTSSSTSETPTANGKDHLDLNNFRKTRDFGDYQILTDSPSSQVNTSRGESQGQQQQPQQQQQRDKRQGSKGRRR
jgi:hypothetical protein